MALRDQPYIPLYVQDFLTDEKLSECSASATGVYIRLMCLMHKNETYGKILLKQKFKQTTNQIKNFASQIAKNMPYDFHTVANALEELIAEKVLLMEDGVITQKRMVKDNKTSESRSNSGKIGGKKTQENLNVFAKANAKAKDGANSEYESENENEVKIDFENKGGAGGKPQLEYPFESLDFKVLWQGWKTHLVEVGKPYQTFSTEQAALQFLKDYPEPEATEIINTAIRGGWKNLRKPEKNAAGKHANYSNERQASLVKLHELSGEVLRHVEFKDDYAGPRE